MINAKRYQQQLTDLNLPCLRKTPKYRKREHGVIFLRDNAPLHVKKGSMNVLQQEGVVFTNLLALFTQIARKMEHALNKAFFIILPNLGTIIIFI